MNFPKIYPVACHTDNVGPGTTFVAIKGFSSNGLDFVPDAIAKGASKLVIQEDEIISSSLATIIEHANIPVERVQDTRRALAHLSAQAAGYPAHMLHIIGVTGTKGKTTTTFLIAHLLKQAGYSVALTSTVKNTINDQDFPACLTTPQPDYLHQFLHVCVKAGVTHVVMEVAAQALSLFRVEGISFDAVVFTNFALEHLEFYTSMEDYFAAKCMLLALRKDNAPAYINNDDSACSSLQNRYTNLISYGSLKDAFITTRTQNNDTVLKGTITIQDATIAYTCPALLGSFNGYNIAAAVGIAWHYGVKEDGIIQALHNFPGVAGRLERYNMPNGACMIIDYAHNPQSYEQLLSMLRTMTRRLIVVFGAGGQRDASKRPLMGEVAARYADVIILTSDNPRTEDPATIIADIVRGIPIDLRSKVIQEIDRTLAIAIAYRLSLPNSIVVLLGKGPERYQIIGSTKHFFSEPALIKSLQS